MRTVERKLELLNKLNTFYYKYDENTIFCCCKNTRENVEIIRDLNVDVTVYFDSIIDNCFNHEKYINITYIILKTKNIYCNCDYDIKNLGFSIVLNKYEYEFLKKYRNEGYKYIKCFDRFKSEDKKKEYLKLYLSKNDIDSFGIDYDNEDNYTIKFTDYFYFINKDEETWDIDWLLNCDIDLKNSDRSIIWNNQKIEFKKDGNN